MNRLLQPYIAGVQQAVQCPLYDPLPVYDARQRFRRGEIASLRRANSVYIPAGRWDTRAWVLLAREDYDQLNLYATSLQLEISDPMQANNIGVLKNLAVRQAQCVTRGLEADPKALYLVELTDGRGILSNEWFQALLSVQYNIRAPGYPDVFYTNSMNGGTTWTWATMLQDVWSRINLGSTNLLGSWPGLPTGVTISGTPEGFWFPGVSAWQALNDTLEHIGLTIACDLTQDDPYTIVRPGADDSSFAVQLANYGSTTSPLYCLEDDSEWVDRGSGRVPGKVKVLFRRRNTVYGVEETVRRDSLQWTTTSYYSVTVDAPALFVGAVGEHFLWSDFTVRYDQNGDPMAADVVTANSIAQERVTDYFTKIYRQTLGSMSQVYAGALPFITGSQIDGVCYSQDYKESSGDNWCGWQTKITRGDLPPFAEIWS